MLLVEIVRETVYVAHSYSYKNTPVKLSFEFFNMLYYNHRKNCYDQRTQRTSSVLHAGIRTTKGRSDRGPSQNQAK